MSFHDDKVKDSQPTRAYLVVAPRPRNSRFAWSRLRTLLQRPQTRPSRHPDWASYEEVIADDSPMIQACYEAHLAMRKMLEVFAELRGDAAEEAWT
jgi:hypothetical protein